MNDLHENEVEVFEEPKVINDSGDKKKTYRGWFFALFFVMLVAFLITGINSGFLTKGYYEVQKAMRNKIRISSGSYSGETDFGVFSGQGAFNFGTGEQYTGEWSDYQFQGYGELQYPDIGNYCGDFLDGHKHGTGIFTWDDGDSYSGEWQNDSFHGEGKYTFSNGDMLEGLFENGLFLSGTYVSENTLEFIIFYTETDSIFAMITFPDGTIYEGEFVMGTIAGRGEMRYTNGDTYIGEYDSSKRSGVGTYTWSFGDTYSGDWANDKMEGNGKYTFASGMVLSGNFEGNEFLSGECLSNAFVFRIEAKKPTNVTFELENGLKYSGGFSAGNINGNGEMVYPSGDIYIGDFANGFRHGKGTYTWTSGATYSGDWKDDKMHGAGVYRYASKSDGYQLEGSFRNGVPNGECKYYTSSSNHYVTTWKNGSCVKVTE